MDCIGTIIIQGKHNRNGYEPVAQTEFQVWRWYLPERKWRLYCDRFPTHLAAKLMADGQAPLGYTHTVIVEVRLPGMPQTTEAEPC